MMALVYTDGCAQRWMDEYLRWNTSDYSGLEDIWIPAMHIWTPDIFINNL